MSACAKSRLAEPEYSDVLIIGAGISGIGAAYRIHEKNPKLSYRVLERRARIGGTWDLNPLSGHPVRQRHLHAELSLRAVDSAGERRRRARHPRVSDPDRAQARHRQAHPLQHPGRVGGLGFDHRHLDRADRGRRRAEDLPRPVPVLRHRLLQLRRALPAGFPGHRGIHRRGRASTALAGIVGLHGQEGAW